MTASASTGSATSVFASARASARASALASVRVSALVSARVSMPAAAFVVTLALVGSGCAGIAIDGPDRGSDGGAGVFIDAGTTPPPGEPSALPARTSASPDMVAGELDSQSGRSECYAESNACETTTCADVRSCCVGSGECCEDLGAAAPVAALDASGCTPATPAADCFGAAVSAFGAPAPSIYGMGIAPNGSASSDGGLLVGGPVDLTVHRAILRATFVPPSACDGACVETVALGVTTQSTVTSAVRPIAALVYSGGLARMILVVGDVAVHRWDDVAAAEEWTLDLRPSGLVVVGRASGDGFSAAYTPVEESRVALWGRTLNPPPDATPTHLASFTPTISLCDVPSAWGAHRPLDVVDTSGAPFGDGALHAPSVLDRADGRVVAFETNGAIFVAASTMAAPDRFTLVSDTPVLTANATEAWMSSSVGDPELVEVDGGDVDLFFTAWSAATDGAAAVPWVGRVRLAPGLSALADVPSALAVSGWPDRATRSALTLAEPSLLQHESGEWVLAARAALEDGYEEIVLLRSLDRDAWSFHDATQLHALSSRPSQTPLFDSDELGHPTLVIHNGAWQLYYAGRRGARWAVGLLLSDDLVGWRRIEEEAPVLRGRLGAFDGVSVLAPDVVVSRTRVELVYQAEDGVAEVLGAVTRTATDSGRR